MHPLIEQQLTSVLHKLAADGQPIPHNAWQKLLSKTLRSLLPAPHQSPWMEWEYGTWIGVFAGYDEVGRQLGEANVLPEWLATPLADSWHVFKGSGVRNGHPFNATAMHEMLDCWDDLLLDAASLRNIYCRRHQREGRLAAKDLFIITSVAVSIPGFMLRRGDTPTQNGTIPRRAAAAFKVLGGMYAATNRMMSQGHAMLTQQELDIDEFLQYLEDERLLLSPESRACAAPVKMIQQILKAVIDPNDLTSADQGLAHLGADAERAFDYGCLCARIDLAVLLYWRSLNHFLLPVFQHADMPIQLKEILSTEMELGILDAIPLNNYREVARQLLDLFTACQVDEDFLAAIPKNNLQDPELNLEQIGAKCFQLETAMRSFALQQQMALNQVLKRPAPQLKQTDWSPAPPSLFLKNLFKDYPQLAGTLD